MKKENIAKTHEKKLKKIDSNLEEIYKKLYSLDVQNSELTSISNNLNELLRENEHLKENLNNDITKTIKQSHKSYLAYAVLTLLVLGSSFINFGLAIILLSAELGMIIKSIGNTTITDLEAIKDSAGLQNYRIVRYQKNASNRIKMKSKEIDDSEVFGINFNDAYEKALECVRLLLDGSSINIENPLVKSIVKELLKDENYPNASIEELVELKRSKMNKYVALEKHLN